MKRGIKRCDFARAITSTCDSGVGARPACQIMALLLVLSGVVSAAPAEPPPGAEAEAAGVPSASPGKSLTDSAAARQYTYSWLFSDAVSMKPRGGTTQGPKVTISKTRSASFLALQEPGLAPRARDRRAILAMAGDYRTSFDFIETIGFTLGYKPTAPYQSWGTERVYVVANEPEFISLQHIIVMHFQLEDGTVSEPMVVKHWRQDWRYEDRELHAFKGRNTWEKQRLTDTLAKGAWTQTVFQVDDSPRYEAIGRWEHSPGASFWESESMRRPLPRREFSVRDDYQALYGSHRISITPGGWIQEEDALKLVLGEDNQADTEQPYLAREAGLSRYERIRDYDFAAGDAYWARTGAFWAEVRSYWDKVYAEQDRFELQKNVDGKPLYVALFELADQSELDGSAQQAELEATMSRYLKAGP